MKPAPEPAFLGLIFAPLALTNVNTLGTFILTVAAAPLALEIEKENVTVSPAWYVAALAVPISIKQPINKTNMLIQIVLFTESSLPVFVHGLIEHTIKRSCLINAQFL
jgi:hypothetical protein